MDVLDGVALPNNEAMLISAIVGLDDDPDRPTRLVHIGSTKVDYADVPENIVALSLEKIQTTSGGSSLLALAKSGNVYPVNSQIETPERIGRRDGGTFIALNVEGDEVYAVGMNGQISRRAAENWINFDDGVYTEERSVFSPQLRDIAGSTKNRILTVGMFGEIFEFQKESWRKLDLFTNVNFERVIKGENYDEFWVLGDRGTIVHNTGAEWRFLPTYMDDNIWGAVVIEDALLVSTLDGVFSVDRETGVWSLLETDLQSQSSSYYRLSSGFGCVWSFGPKDVFRLKDGRWDRQLIPCNE